MTSPGRPPIKEKKQQCRTRDKAEVLDDTLTSASVTTPANLPMVVIRDYNPTSCQYDGVKVTSGTVVSALYKTGKYLFVRTPENLTGFLPSSIVRPLCSLKDIKSAVDINLYQNLPKQPNRNVKFVSPGRCSTTSSCGYVVAGQCHCHACMDVSSQSYRAPNMYDPRLHSTFCSCCSVDSRVSTLRSNTGLSFHSTTRSNYVTRNPKRRQSRRDSSFDSCYASSEMSSSSSDDGSSSKRYTPCTKTRSGTGTNQCSRYQGCIPPSAWNVHASSTPMCSSERPHKRRPTSSLRGTRLTVIFDFNGHYESDLSVMRQDVVTLLDEEGMDWLWVRRCDGKEGFIPRSYTVNLEALNLDPHCRTTYL